MRSTLNQDLQKKVAQQIQPMLVDLLDLTMTAKQLHWNVTGPRFRPVHAHLDELTAAYRTWSDQVAERLTAVGVPADGRSQRVVEDTPLDPAPEEWVTDDDAVRVMAERVEQIATRTRERVEELDKIDLASQDVLLEILAGLEEQLWMLSAQEE